MYDKLLLLIALFVCHAGSRILNLVCLKLGDKHTMPCAAKTLHAGIWLFGSMVACAVFGFQGYIASLVQTLIVYIILRQFTKYSMTKYIVLIGVLLITFVLQLERAFRLGTSGFGRVDYAICQMLLAIKLSSVAFQVRDGYIRKLLGAKSLKNGHWDAQAVNEIPGLLEFLGYVYFFPTFLTGPTLNLQLYKDYFNHYYYHHDDDDDDGTDKLHPNKLPRNVVSRAANIRIVKSLIYFGISLMLDWAFGAQTLMSLWFAECRLITKVLVMWGYVLSIKCKYYAAWTFGEANAVACGIAYSGKKENKYEWENGVNVRPWAVETADNVKTLQSNWNLCTQDWLKNCIYLRLKHELKLRETVCMLTTNMVAACWHGFYFGYLVTFLSSGALTSISRLMYARIRPHIIRLSQKEPGIRWIYSAIGTLAIQVILSYTIVGFGLLEFWKTWHVYKQVYFYGWVTLPALFAALMLIPKTSKYY